MRKVESGTYVKVHYTGKLNSGEVFDSSEDREPLGFTIGASAVIPGFEEAVVGLAAGEGKTVVIDPENAYGERDEEKLVSVERSALGDDFDPEEGMMLALQMENGSRQMARVASLDVENVTLDFNHPLAGETLHFTVKVVEILDESDAPACSSGCCSSCSSCG